MRARRSAFLAALLTTATAAAQQDGGPAPPRPYAVARRVPPPPGDGARPVGMNQIVVGEGWGCGGSRSEAGIDWQCWEAGPHPQAWAVPWLHNKDLQGGPDRLCAFERPGLMFRCWQRPRHGDAGPRELPASWEWLNPHHAPWGDSYKRGDWVGKTWVGGTFACLQTEKDSGVFCRGDDRYGQLGGSAVPGPNAGPHDPAFVRDLWPAMFPAVGTWHACALAAPYGMGRGGHVACWGRGDVGQLGGPATESCAVDGQSVPCARHPVKGPATDGMAVLRLGDLFSCVTNRRGIQCWGASRDGFFGARGSCPESLRRAWPTLAGPVAAPDAACSATPVDIPGAGPGFDPHFLAGPRGLCFSDGDGRRCVGAVPSPSRGQGIAALSPGSDASACGFHQGGVVCWGEAYSPPGARDRPVAIGFQPAAPIGETAVVGDTEVGERGASCLIRRGCKLAPRPLPVCAAATSARPAAEIVAAADALRGKIVGARGPLGVVPGSTTLVFCRHECCNGASASIVLGAAAKTLRLDGLGCHGDESLVCCDTPAYGQSVVATGRLQPDDGVPFGAASRWKLVDVTLCVDPPAATSPPR